MHPHIYLLTEGLPLHFQLLEVGEELGLWFPTSRGQEAEHYLHHIQRLAHLVRRPQLPQDVQLHSLLQAPLHMIQHIVYVVYL